MEYLTTEKGLARLRQAERLKEIERIRVEEIPLVITILHTERRSIMSRNLGAENCGS